MKKALLALLLLSALPAQADIISTTGLTQIAAPASVGADFLIGSGLQQVIFAERQGVTLISSLFTDTGMIAAGTVVNSYFFAVNSNVLTIVDTSVLFNAPVLGIVYRDGPDPYGSGGAFNPLFSNSNFLGAAGTAYSNFLGCTFCGFEVSPSADMDSASFLGNTALFHNNYSNPGDFARIVTQAASPVPGPIVGAGVPGLLLLAGMILTGVKRRFRNGG